jgi:hypothetical protein
MLERGGGPGEGSVRVINNYAPVAFTVVPAEALRQFLEFQAEHFGTPADFIFQKS